MKNERREKIKVEKVIKQPRGQELSLRRLDSRMSRGEEMGRMKRTCQQKSRSCFLIFLPPTLDPVHIS